MLTLTKRGGRGVAPPILNFGARKGVGGQCHPLVT